MPRHPRAVDPIAVRSEIRLLLQETSPTATVFLLGDMGMLDYMENKLPWIMRVKTELPTRELRQDGTEYPVKVF